MATERASRGATRRHERRSQSKQGRLRSRPPYGLIAPAVIYLLVFQTYPLAEGVRLSLTDTSLLNPRSGNYVGLENYANIIGSSAFNQVLYLTLIYALVSVVLAIVVGMGAALVMHHPFRGRAFLRGAVTVPWATPQVAVALIFVWMFNNQYGVINYLLTAFGLTSQYHRWLDNVNLAMPAVLVVSVWMIFPFTALALLAAMQSIPDELYEAAKIDGADPVNQFKQVTLPAIRPTLVIVALFLTIWALRRFEIIWLLTQGGPAGSTGTLVVDLYREAFRFMRLGSAAAIGVLGVAIAAIVAAVFLWTESRNQRLSDV